MHLPPPLPLPSIPRRTTTRTGKRNPVIGTGIDDTVAVLMSVVVDVNAAENGVSTVILETQGGIPGRKNADTTETVVETDTEHYHISAASMLENDIFCW